MPAFPPRKMMLEIVQPNQQYGRSLKADLGWPIVYNDDLAQLWWGIGPQIDGLGHLGKDDIYYNCNKGADFAALTGLKKLGIHNIPPLVGRGVLIDMAKHFGVESLAGVVLFHTGWTDAKLEADPQTWVSSEPGISNAVTDYLASLNPMAVGADTWGVDVVPPLKGEKVFYGHVVFLKENGI
jgi:Putative cyclase